MDTEQEARAWLAQPCIETMDCELAGYISGLCEKYLAIRAEYLANPDAHSPLLDAMACAGLACHYAIAAHNAAMEAVRPIIV